jgi:hypothetical protein
MWERMEKEIVVEEKEAWVWGMPKPKQVEIPAIEEQEPSENLPSQIGLLSPVVEAESKAENSGSSSEEEGDSESEYSYYSDEESK